MRRGRLWLSISMAWALLGSVGLAIACDTEDQKDTGRTGEQVEQAAREAWTELRTDGERLIDNIQTNDDPAAKQRLLDECRDAEERLRRAGSGQADRVNEFCDRIRDADVGDDRVWDDLRRQLRDLTDELERTGSIIR